MNAALAELLALTNAFLWQGIAVFLRVGAVVAFLPAFGERTVPVRIKLAITLAFVFVIAPALPPLVDQPGIGTLLRLTLTETLNGLVLAIGIRLIVMALQTAGAIAAQSTSLSQVLGGAAVDPLPAMGHILVVGALALAVMSGLHVKAAMLILLSYDFLPLGVFPDGSALSQWGIAQVARAFALAFSLAAPFVILSVIYNLTLGVINRAMPQLMVAFVGAPVITAGGLVILMLAAPLMLEVWLRALDSFLANPLQAVE